MTFFAPVALIWWGFREGSLVAIILGVALMLAFAVLVARHAHVLGAIDAAEAGLRVARRGVGRINRDWTMLPDMAAVAPPDSTIIRTPGTWTFSDMRRSPSWLGRSATPTGQSSLSDGCSRASRRTPSWQQVGSTISRLVPSGARRSHRRLFWGGQHEAELARFLSWAEKRAGHTVVGQLAAIGVTTRRSGC